MSEKVSFDEFSPLSKSDWLEQIIQDLKIKSFEELDWTLDQGIKLGTFYHDYPKPLRTPVLYSKNQDWQFLAYLTGADQSKVEAILDHGINSIMITQPEQVELFKSVRISEPVQLHVISHSNQLQVLKEALNQIPIGKIHIASVRLYDRPLVVRSSFTGHIHLDSNYIWMHNTNEHEVWTDNIAQQLITLCSNLDELAGTKESNPVKVIYSVKTGNVFLKEIIKLRALKVLLVNIWGAYGYSNETLPEIEAHVVSDDLGEDYYSNVTHNTTKALSAVIGGIDRLMIRPLTTGDETADRIFQRVNRNIHHILKVESFMDKIIDPSAGSYLLDEGTRHLALITWNKFKELRT